MVPSLTGSASHFFEMTDHIVILSTCASEEEAEKLARLLLDQRLCACVNVVPRVRSFFLWKGKVDSGDEALLLIKSSRALFPAVVSAVEAAHSYEVPEVIALPIVDGSSNYIDWLRSSIGEKS